MKSDLFETTTFGSTKNDRVRLGLPIVYLKKERNSFCKTLTESFMLELFIIIALQYRLAVTDIVYFHSIQYEKCIRNSYQANF